MEKLEAYERLSSKYLEEAGPLLRKGDATQAGEKLWGAVAAAVKAAAARRGEGLKTHAELWSFILSLHKEKPGLELRRLFGVADHLHSNFYEDELPLQAVEGFAEDVRELVAKLEAI
jgi:hypothetical protein